MLWKLTERFELPLQVPCTELDYMYGSIATTMLGRVSKGARDFKPFTVLSLRGYARAGLGL